MRFPIHALTAELVCFCFYTVIEISAAWETIKNMTYIPLRFRVLYRGVHEKNKVLFFFSNKQLLFTCHSWFLVKDIL